MFLSDFNFPPFSAFVIVIIGLICRNLIASAVLGCIPVGGRLSNSIPNFQNLEQFLIFKNDCHHVPSPQNRLMGFL